jgi:rSAM/selenodomain-associated transferase 1
MSTLVIFARAPILGGVKTRLSRALGEATALALYEAFLDDTCLLTQGLGARRVLAVHGDLEHPALTRMCKSHRLAIEPQAEGDLGAKLAAAVAKHLPHGPVVIIGSDAPTLPRAHLHQALDALMDHDVVVGPAGDGGYYLVGARVPVPEIFAGIAWSTPAVWPTTEERRAGRSYAVLPPWYDIDEPADLRRLIAELATLPPSVAPATRRALAALPNGGDQW